MNKMIKTLMVMTLTLATVVGVGTTKANAAEQGHWNYHSGPDYSKYFINGSYVTGWQKIGEFWYYFDNNGEYAMDTIIDGKYYVAPTGVWDGETLSSSTQISQCDNTTQTTQNNNTVRTIPNSNSATISYAEFTKIADDKMLELINAHRIENGVGTLEWDQTLADMSTEKDEHMIRNNYVAHSYKNTSTMDVQEVCYKHNIDSENCLANYNYVITKTGAVDLATSMFNQWKASPGHNQNMLDPTWKEFGFGFAFSNGKADYASYGTHQIAIYHD